MFDSEYFRTTLSADVEATNPEATVEVHLLNGHTLRLRSVLAVHSEYVAFEVYRAPRNEGTHHARWHGVGVAMAEGGETLRATVSYQAVAAVTVIPPRGSGEVRVGFGS